MVVCVEFAKTSFLERKKTDMPSHYTAPEMFLFTDTKFKIRIEFTEYQYEATEKHVSMVVDGEKGFLSNQETAWVRRGAQPRAGLDKGSK